MKNGIYFVAFRSNQQDSGYGIAVIKNGDVNGGDYGFTYQGKVEGSHILMRIIQHDPSTTSVFPGIQNFELSLSSQESERDYLLNGFVVEKPEMEICIDAKFIGELI